MRGTSWTDVRWTGTMHERELRLAVLGQRKLPMLFSSRSEETLEIQRIQRESLAILIKLGYYFAKIDSVAIGERQELVLFVNEGERYVIHRVDIYGDLLPSEFTFESAPGDVLDPAILESDIQRLLQQYERSGYPLASVITENIEIDSVGLVIGLRVERNGIARIGRITVQGNSVTEAHVITREFGVRVGELLLPSKLRAGRDALERLGYFSEVYDPQIFLIDDSTVEVRIKVTEARTTAIDAVLGYNPPRNTAESGYLTGLVDLGFRNIAGTGRDAAVHYSSLSRGTQRLMAKYREPWILSYPLHVDLSFDQYQQDSSYVSTQMQGGLTYSLTQNIALKASLLYDRTIPTDLPESPFIAYNSRKLLTLLAASYDSRDELLSPSSGLLMKLGGNYGTKRLNGPDRFLTDSIDRASTISELALELHFFQQTFSPKLVFAAALHAKRTAVFGSTLDQSDLTRLGGARTLRGYRENELLANRFAYLNIEYRFLTARQSYLFLFTDAGWLERGPIIGDPTTIRSTPLGYGLGVQQLTPVGVLTLSIGLSRDENFDRAKVHFGLLTRI